MAFSAALSPAKACSPADMTSTSTPACCALCLIKYSAMTLRQVLPEQTNKTDLAMLPPRFLPLGTDLPALGRFAQTIHDSQAQALFTNCFHKEGLKPQLIRGPKQLVQLTCQSGQIALAAHGKDGELRIQASPFLPGHDTNLLALP